MSSSVRVGPLQLLKLVLVGVSLLLGMSGLVFFMWAENFRATWKCATLVLACAVLLHLNYSVVRGKLPEKYSLTRLKRWRRISVILGVTSFLLLLSNAALGYMGKQGFQWRGSGYYAACIPSFLSLVWFVVLAFETDSHLKEIPKTRTYAILSEEGAVVV